MDLPANVRPFQAHWPERMIGLSQPHTIHLSNSLTQAQENSLVPSSLHKPIRLTCTVFARPNIQHYQCFR